MNLIEDLYLGNVRPNEDNVRKSGYYTQILKRASKLEEKLLNELGLSEEAKKLFMEYCETESEIISQEAKAGFTKGFKLGGRMMAEVFYDPKR